MTVEIIFSLFNIAQINNLIQLNIYNLLDKQNYNGRTENEIFPSRGYFIRINSE
jgi:hypothetical protein